jgi:ATP-dependent RNA helicase RhlE
MADHAFAHLKLNRQILKAIDELGWSAPTEIQSRAAAPIMANQNLIGISPSGTGKSAAYLMPLIMKIKHAQGSEPRALVLVPTRELAVQVAAQASSLSGHTDLRVAGIYGGAGNRSQRELVTGGIDILVATPGRFLEFYAEGTLSTKKLTVFVIDEADRMMEMGFLPQLRKTIDVLPVKRQNLLFSATFSDRVARISEDFLEFPLRVEVKPQATLSDTVVHQAYKLPNLGTKIHLLLHWLALPELNRAMIFCRSKETADNLGHFIDRKGLGPVRVIHSNKGQNSRLNAVNELRAGSLRVLVATDVASRGIDVPEVTHVINFDVPLVPADYVHRIGRTGRANQSGVAITLCTPPEQGALRRIEELIQLSVPVVPLPPGVPIEETSSAELQSQAKQIDRQKQKEDPSFRGAFHSKKKYRN